MQTYDCGKLASGLPGMNFDLLEVSIRKVHRFGRVARANRAALLAERSQDGESEGGIE